MAIRLQPVGLILATIYFRLTYSLLISPSRDRSTPCQREGDFVTFLCRITDEYVAGGTVWNGSIFDCPSINDIANNQIYLPHIPNSYYNPTCNDGKIIAETVGQNQSVFFTRLSLTASREMDGGTVACSFLGISHLQSETLEIGGLLCM